jgi:hypothetical protein
MGESRDTGWFVSAHRERVQHALVQALHDPESQVRAVVALALTRWGDRRSVEPLLGLIQDEDAEVRRQVIETVGYPKNERTLEPLLHAFFHRFVLRFLTSLFLYRQVHEGSPVVSKVCMNR